MANEIEDEGMIRKYLLCRITEHERQQLEERIMTDNELYNRTLLAEDELVEAYVLGELSGSEREGFEAAFLSTPEGRKQVSFAKALSTYTSKSSASGGPADEVAAAQEPARITEERARAGKVSRPVWWSRPALVPYFTLAAVAVMVVGLGLGIWRVFFFQSEVSKGMAALNSAYRQQRPVEPRISGFDYAPTAVTRGGPQKVDTVSLNRAERILLDEAAEHPSAASHHALGRLYLAEQKFDDAIKEFEEALLTDPNNAQLHNDYGAALLEKGKADRATEESGKGLEELARSLDHLSRALDLDNNLLEALFNRAILYQEMMLPRQAQADLEKYLEKEPNARWAAEAREKLREINSQQGGEKRQKSIAVDDFLSACAAGEEERAWEILRANRDVISGNLIWEQLANASLEASLAGLKDRARLKLSSMSQGGRLEALRTGDPFVSELANFYSKASLGHLAILAGAHNLVERGRERYFEGNYGEASDLFTNASEQFDRAGDSWEAGLARLRVVHCYLQTGEAKESLSILEPLTQLCEKRNYLWLLAHTYNSNARAQTVLGESSKYIEKINRSLDIFERINDQPAVQKGLAQLASEYGALGNHDAAMDCLDRCMARCANYWPGARQAWRNYDTAAMILDSMGLRAAAAAFEQEALQLSLEEIKDPSFTYLSFTRLGTIYGRQKDYGKAVSFAQRGLETSRSFLLEKDRSAMVAFSLLQLGHIYRMAGSFSAALDHYNQAIDLCEVGNLQVYLYEGHKGRLLCHLSQQNDAAVGEELAATLNLFDLYRSRILEETSRNTFFDQEQGVYDIAIDFEFSKMNHPQKAFEYSEKSRARSLLAIMNAPPRLAQRNNKPDLLIRRGSPTADLQPLTEPEITNNVSNQAQLLQYAVLNDKVLIWVISRKRFWFFKKEISIDELKRKVFGFLQHIQSTPMEGATAGIEEAAELYQILIEPAAQVLDSGKLICVVPDKLLNHLPFGALFSPTARKRLIEMYSVMTSPSSTVFLRQTEKAQEKERMESQKALGVGDPEFDRRVFDLPPLQSAADEVRSLEKYYAAAVVLTGKAAKAGAVKREMQMSNIIHFATHYVIDERYPQLSGVLLASEPSPQPQESDGMLRSYEIYSLDLRRTRVVVLAACQTGIDRYFNGEGAIGFSRAFLAAGVPVVVASLWPVDSSATTDLMVNFHRYRTSGFSSADALRRAQIDMISDSQDRRDQPFYWASFTVIGGYATF